MKSLNSATVLGALVADSASLGLHWIYDPARIAEIEQGATPFPRQNALFPRMAVEAAGDFNPRKGVQTWIGSAGRNKKRSDSPATACLIQGLQHIQGVALHAGWRLGQKAAVDCETILQAHR